MSKTMNAHASPSIGPHDGVEFPLTHRSGNLGILDGECASESTAPSVGRKGNHSEFADPRHQRRRRPLCVEKASGLTSNMKGSAPVERRTQFGHANMVNKKLTQFDHTREVLSPCPIRMSIATQPWRHPTRQRERTHRTETTAAQAQSWTVAAPAHSSGRRLHAVRSHGSSIVEMRENRWRSSVTTGKPYRNICRTNCLTPAVQLDTSRVSGSWRVGLACLVW